MDPNQLYSLFAQMRQQQPGGMFGGQPQPDPNDPSQQQHHHGGFNPLMMLSPVLGLMMQHPKYGLMALSPALGLANILGAFK